jgi:hypothetical protein
MAASNGRGISGPESHPQPTPEQLRMAEINLGEIKVHERHRTIRFLGGGCFFLGALGMVTWAVIR